MTTLSTFRSKRFFAPFLIALFGALSVFGAADSRYADMLFIPADAMDLYEGKWTGTQILMLPDGTPLMSMHIEQTYQRGVVDNRRALVSAATVTAAGQRVDVGSRMILCAWGMELVVTDSGGKEYEYIGRLVDGAVVWIPNRLCLLLDVQNDFFTAGVSTIKMLSTNIKDVNEKSYRGRLVSRTELSRDNTARSKSDSKKEGGLKSIFKRGRGTLF